jgi:hypothetical protein
VIIDIVAHVLHEFGDQMCAYRLVLASLDGNAARTIVAGVRADARQGFSLQAEN